MNGQGITFDMPIVADPFGTAAKAYALDEARLRNRLMHMQMKDIWEDKQVNRLMSMIPNQILTQHPWESRYGGQFDPATGQPLPGAEAGAAAGAVPVTPQVWEAEAASPETMTTLTPQNKLALLSQNPQYRGLSEAFSRRGLEEVGKDQALTKSALEGIAKIHTISPEASVRAFNNNPRLTALTGGPISMEGTGSIKEYRDETGNVVGYSIRKPDGKWSMVPAKDPTTADAAYLAGKIDQMQKDHPEWPRKRVLFEAGKAIRTENDERQKEKVTFRAMVADAQKVREEDRKEQKGFKGWGEEEKEMSYWTRIITGKDPKFAWGDRNSYTAFQEGLNKFIRAQGMTPAQVARVNTDYKAADRSVANQRKIYDMMYGFAENIKGQIKKVEGIFKTLPRTQIRLLNMPIVELRKRALGSGPEAAAASYLIEISNEIGKLSTGSAASIRELSESAQQQWAKIHDGTLPWKDLEKVLRTTEEQADMRIRTSKQAMDMTRQAIESLMETTKIPPFRVSEPDIIRQAQEELERRRKGGVQ